MKFRSLTLWLVMVLATAGLIAFGCSAGGSGDKPGGAGGAGGEVFVGSGGASDELVITPASVTLDVFNGETVTQQFKAERHGTDVTSEVSWVLEKPAMGSLDDGGLLTPYGTQGGVGRVFALLNEQEATAVVTINVEIKINTAHLTDEEIASFDAPSGPDPALEIVYPYPETVMPLKVASPEFQWNGGEAADVYRFRLSSKHMSYTEYITAPAPSSRTLVQKFWEYIEFSGTGPFSDPLTFELTRRSGTTVYEPRAQDLHIAQDLLYGSVYYWQLPEVGCEDQVAEGKILRIRPGSLQKEEFFQPGDCWGCHTISRDGRTLAGEFNDGGGPLYTVDLSQAPAVYGNISPSTPTGNYVFSAFDDTGTRLLAARHGATPHLEIIDVPTGTVVNTNVLGDHCGEPAWSPDGLQVAGVCSLTPGGWTFDSSTGDLVLGQMNVTHDAATSQSVLVPQSAGVGRPSYPSFAPDSRYVVYSRPTVGSRSIGNGKLWLVDTANGQAKELLTASSDNRSFNPVFAPKSAGGFTWVMFISRRDYGNKIVGKNSQRLWITAVSDPPNEDDPSFPPYFVRGQSHDCKSENAFYALDPCKENGEGCEHGIECCNKSCVYDDGLDEYVCATPDPGECIETNSGPCVEDADCCDVDTGVICIGGFCTTPPPQ